MSGAWLRDAPGIISVAEIQWLPTLYPMIAITGIAPRLVT
jgi:hypothetical protein